ncbi:MAG: beta strand repeat-containing protein [Thermoplasmataceae archaeon]
MNVKTILSLLLVSTMISASGSVFASPGSTGNSQLFHSSGSPSVFHGNVTVYPNGTISSHNAPISISGQHYRLTEDINGSLRFELSNAILNGNSFKIIGNNGSNPALVVSNSSVVSVANLTVISGNSSAVGVLVENSSKDSIDNINVTAPSLGLLMSSSTADVNVSYSRVSVGGNHDMAMAAVVAGGDISANHFITPVSGSRNISLYADTISNAGGLYGILINSPNSSLMNSNVTMTGKSNSTSLSSILVLADQNNTIVDNNVLNANNVSLAAGFGNYSTSHSLYTGEEFNGNTLTITSPSSNSLGPASGLESLFSDMNVTRNHIYAKNMKSDSTLLLSIYGDTNISNNEISIVNSSGVGAFISYVGNVTMDSNSIVYSQNSPLLGYTVINGYDYSVRLNDNSIVANNGSTGSAIISVDQIGMPDAANSINGNYLESMNSSAYGIVFNGTDTSISQNILHLNGFEPNGIVFSGTNLTVSSNEINIESSISSTGIGDFYTSNNFGIDNSNISGNTINITGDASGQIFGMYLINSIQHLGITSNYLYSNASKFQGIDFSLGSMSNVSISQNTIMYSALHTGIFNGLNISSVSTILISGNTVQGIGNSGMNAGSYTLSIKDSPGITVSNNTFEGANTSVSLTHDENITFYGNYVMNEYTALSINGVNNAIFYHNNFEGFNVTAVLSGSTNLSFNASYPVGGNYWSNHTGVDQYSGPEQNIAGSDGIGDTPYKLNNTIRDNYPLMKPWTRPMATFTETGLAPGQQWSVSFNGKTVITTQQVISFPILNATYQGYAYSVGTLSGYTGGGQSGTLNYSGNGFSRNITYLEFAQLHIKILPQNATIIINGQTYSTNNGSFNISLAVGNYSIQFERSGYNTDSINLTLTAGEIKYVNISLSRVAGSNDLLYYVFAGIATVVIAALAFYFARRRSH